MFSAILCPNERYLPRYSARLYDVWYDMLCRLYDRSFLKLVVFIKLSYLMIPVLFWGVLFFKSYIYYVLMLAESEFKFNYKMFFFSCDSQPVKISACVDLFIQDKYSIYFMSLLKCHIFAYIIYSLPTS